MKLHAVFDNKGHILGAAQLDGNSPVLELGRRPMKRRVKRRPTFMCRPSTSTTIWRPCLNDSE